MKPSVTLTIIALAGHLSNAGAQSTTGNENAAFAHERAALLAAAKTFCTELHRESVSGLPGAEQLQRLSPLLMPELVALFERARTLQEQQIRKYPDEKPYWVEGDLFSSSFEGVSSWEIGEAFHAPNAEATVQVRRTYAEANQEPVIWTDTLVFKQHEQGWLLDDIRMGGEWAFKSGSSLRGILPGGGKEYEDHVSLDERWRVSFTRDGDEVTRVAIQPGDRSGEPVILFGIEADQACPMPTWVVWGPNSDRIALRLGDSPRFTRTLIFRLVGESWEPVTMPEFYPEEKKTMLGHGFRERDRLIDAEHWQDADTLVVEYFGSFEKGDEGDGYLQHLSVHIDDNGEAKVVGAVDVVGGE